MQFEAAEPADSELLSAKAALAQLESDALDAARFTAWYPSYASRVLTADGDRLKIGYCDSQVLVDGAGQVIAEARRETQEDRAKTDRAKGRRRR